MSALPPSTLLTSELPSEPWLAHLLALPTPAEQLRELRAAQCLSIAGLTVLLDYAERLTQRNPGQTRQLAALCETAAQQIAAAALVPRARYLRAQCHAINGELALALSLVEAAHQGFTELGLPGEALRTNIGRMRVLGELGRFQDALATGQAVVAWLEAQPAADDHTLPAATTEAQTLLALVKTQQGICYDQLGYFEAALAAFHTAETLYEQVVMPVQSAAVKNNRGLALLYLGRVREALSAFAAAAAIQAAEGLPLAHAHTQSNLGEAHLLLGNYRSALAAFETARLTLAAQDALTDEQINLRQMADAYLALNLFDEALATYREVEQHLARAAMMHERAWALWGMGAALAGQEQLTEAAAALSAAAATFAAAENSPLLAGVRLEQAALRERQGDKEEALHLAQQALALVATANWPVQQFLAHLRVADLCFPDPVAAEQHLTAAQALSDRLALPHLRYRLAQRFGRLRLLQQQPVAAAVLLEQAVVEIEALRNTLPLEPMRISFLRDKVAVYEMLVQIYLEIYLAHGDAANLQRAFRMAEQARARTLLERMAGLLETQFATANTPELEQQIQALQTDLDVIYSRLLTQELGGADENAPERALDSTALHTRALLLEQELQRLRLLAGPYVAPPDFFTMSLPLDTLQQHLGADQALVVYYLLGDEVLAFVAARRQLHVVRQLSMRSEVATLLHRLHTQWERFRAGSSFIKRHLPLLLQSTQRILQELYQALFAPVDALLATLLPTASALCHLTIVPHGLLHGVPFQALFDGQRSLLERYILAYAPSATALALLPVRPVEQRTQIVVMGVTEPGLPAIAREVATVAAQFATPLVHCDGAATILTLIAAAPTATILHLACHGIFRADNPMFSALKLADGWLTAADMAQLRLPCALVVLSACESGRGQSLAGDEMLGLARAFLGAGVATLVVSQWMVQDEVTATLMAHFYANLVAGQTAAMALRTAQLAIKVNFAHPYYWAPFVLLGNDSLRLPTP